MMSVQRFEPSEHLELEHDPGLLRRVEELLNENRHRTAMDEVLRHLRRDPDSGSALLLAIMILTPSRSVRLESPEPVTRRQSSSALLAPIMTECSRCRSVWCSNHTLIFKPGVALRILNPIGLQCQTCRYTMCRACLDRTRQLLDEGESEAVDIPTAVEGSCPTPGHGALALPVLPTGRSDVVPVHPDEVEGVIVSRDGPIPPTVDQALAYVTKVVPLTDDDAPLIHVRRAIPTRAMTGGSARDASALSLVHGLEREGALAPGAWERSRRVRLAAADVTDTNYLLIVVRKPQFERTPDWLVELVHDHLRNMAAQHSPARAGECWAGLGSDDVVTATAKLMDQGIGAALRAKKITTLHCAVANYVLAVTVILTADLGDAREWYEDGYLTVLERLAVDLLSPTDDDAREHFVHWTVSTDGATIKLDATVLPADGRREEALFATDMMTPAERRQLGL